jgi:hypothetical protein
MGQTSGNLRTVARGLQFVCAGLAVSVVGVLAPLALLLEFIGRACCLAVPRESRCLGLVRASLLCYLIDFAFSLIILGNFSDHAGPITRFIIFSTPVLGVAAEILFLIAVRRLAEYVGQPRLAGAARSILIAGLCILASTIGLFILPSALSQLFPARGPGALFLSPWGSLVQLVLPIAAFAAAVLILIYAYIIYKLSKAVIEYDDGRGISSDALEDAGSKPASNADIDSLLGFVYELP